MLEDLKEAVLIEAHRSIYSIHLSCTNMYRVLKQKISMEWYEDGCDCLGGEVLSMTMGYDSASAYKWFSLILSVRM